MPRLVLLGGLPLRRPQRRPHADGDPLQGGGPQRHPRQACQQAVAFADGRAGGELRHPPADLQAGLPAVQPPLLIERHEALAAAATVITTAGEGVFAVPGDELARLRGAVTAPAPTLRAGGSVVLRDCGLLLAFQEPALQLVVHRLADVLHRLLNLVECLGRVPQPLLQDLAIASKHCFNQALALFCGHGAPPRRGSMRLQTGSPAGAPMTPCGSSTRYLQWLAWLPGSWIAPGLGRPAGILGHLLLQVGRERRLRPRRPDRCDPAAE